MGGSIVGRAFHFVVDAVGVVSGGGRAGGLHHDKRIQCLNQVERSVASPDSKEREGRGGRSREGPKLEGARPYSPRKSPSYAEGESRQEHTSLVDDRMVKSGRCRERKWLLSQAVLAEWRGAERHQHSSVWRGRRRHAARQSRQVDDPLEGVSATPDLLDAVEEVPSPRRLFITGVAGVTDTDGKEWKASRRQGKECYPASLHHPKPDKP